MKPEPGTYQTTFRVERWEANRTIPRVQFRTTFGGPPIDHNDILTLVRKLHSEKDGKARALIEIFEDAKRWGKYTLNGRNITPEIIERIEELEQELEAAKNYFEDHCGKCDVEDCLGCSYDHIKGLLGLQTSTETTT